MSVFTHVVTCCQDGAQDDPEVAARAEQVRELARSLGFATLYEVNRDDD